MRRREYLFQEALLHQKIRQAKACHSYLMKSMGRVKETMVRVLEMENRQEVLHKPLIIQGGRPQQNQESRMAIRQVQNAL
jgi:DNA repair protein RadC